MRTAELEIVTYRTDEMVHASKELIHNYAQYSGIKGTELWPIMIFTVADIIHNQLKKPCEWTTQGLSIRFSGFLPTLPRINEGKLEYSAKAPHFTLEEGVEQNLLRPAVRTHINRVTNAIVEEMQDVYKLEAVKDADLTFLSFPKDKYAKSIEVITTPLL